MKIRLTLGNILGTLVAGAGYVVGHADALASLAPKVAGPLVMVGTVILSMSKGIISHSPEQIPKDEKSEAGPVVFQKTGPLK